ncbi:NPCBM/NEW2 domain-containing protein [Kitasatospora sp. NPDC057223]|uniref:NPCBM/NEW2 domain-containing protein n=1 Tax=Kitasatospora sp. NPDC057223 TaxID=3346055 RepID=UPI0036325077
MIGIVVPLLGTAGTVWVTSEKPARQPSVQSPIVASVFSTSPSSASAEPAASASRTSTASPSATLVTSGESSPSVPAVSGAGPEKVLLNTLSAIGGSSFRASYTTMRGKEYADSLVSTRECPPRGSVDYNLGTVWSEFTFTAGMDDNSSDTSGSLTITVDGETLWTGSVEVGKPRDLKFTVKDKLRLTISYTYEGSCQGTKSWVSLGNPTLTK